MKEGQMVQWKMRAALRERGAAAPAGTVAGVTEEGAFQQLHAAHMTPEEATHVGDRDTCRCKKQVTEKWLLYLNKISFKIFDPSHTVMNSSA